MEANDIIEAFIRVVGEQDYVFSSEAIEEIPNLQSKLATVDNLTAEAIAEILRQWYINHESVRDAVLVEEREIKKVAPTKLQGQENIVENQYRVLQEELDKLQERKGENKS
ncbi:MAG: hypothetical protein SAK29_14510 [Scytonema sp. PMC 1069.18]|nr:hypothetical protein [Scytonema sp. PMC 1069.18]MEC4883930.1 hypothetical protein [Scytonema sp. PMC 1070.18]